MITGNCCTDILKDGKLKSTRHRIAVLEILKEGKFPLSAEDIYIRLKQNNISISLSTVYRVLEALHEKDIVTKVNIPDNNKAVYELHGSEHRHHLLCVKCRKLFAIDGCPLEEYEKFLEDRFGFTVKGHNLEVYGYCNNCAGY